MKDAKVERIGVFEIYKLGFGTRTWCVRRDGQRGAVNFGSKMEALAYVNKQKTELLK